MVVGTDPSEDVTATGSAPLLRRDTAGWRWMLDAFSDHVAVLDGSGVIVAVNAAWRRFAEQEGGTGTYLGWNYLEVCRRSDDLEAPIALAGIEALLSGERETFELAYPCHGPDERRWFDLRATAIEDGTGERHVVLCHENVTGRHTAERSATLQAALLDEIDAAVVVVDRRRMVRAWNEGAERLYGWPRSEAVGAWLPDLVVMGGRGPDLPAIDELDGSEQEAELRRPDGSYVSVYVRTRLMPDPDGGEPLLAAVAVDITARKATERSVQRARDRLQAVTDHIGDGLCTLDQDGRITYANPAAGAALGWRPRDLLGRSVDELTGRAVADAPSGGGCGTAISRACGSGGTVRVDDGVFVTRDGRAMPVAYTAAPFDTDGGEGGCVVVFRDITARKAEEERLRTAAVQLDMVRRVKDALAEQRFVLYAQPIVDLRTGDVVQRELLVRMLEPSGPAGALEPVPPSSFLPVAEEYGFIGQLDRWVIDRAAELARTGPVELNVSARSVSDPALVSHIAAALRRTGADPGAIVVEITETALIDDEDAARRFVRAVRALGCRVALDDFGTGYGGFTYLKRLSVDFLKIDIEFVQDLRHNVASRNVVQAVVGLAKGFGLRTVAEGVEDAETLELLRAAGVDLAQGYLIGRPGPLAPPAGV